MEYIHNEEHILFSLLKGLVFLVFLIHLLIFYLRYENLLIMMFQTLQFMLCHGSLVLIKEHYRLFSISDKSQCFQMFILEAIVVKILV